LDPTSLSFGDQPVGTTSSPLAVALTNSGNANLVVTSITATSPFSVAPGGTCSGASVAPNSGCIINVVFAPSSVGAVTGTLSVSDNSGGVNSTQTASLSGTGVAAGSPGISFSPSAINFSNVAVGSTSYATTVVTNTGSANLFINGFNLTGSNEYGLASDSCASPIAPGATCSVTISFSPVSGGDATGNLVVTDNVGSGSQSVPLSGDGTEAAVSINAAGLVFGSQPVGTTSASQALTVVNSGAAPLVITEVTTTPGFVITGGNCVTAAVAPGASCYEDIAFSPTHTGAYSGDVYFTDNAPGTPQSAPLTGTGIAAAPIASINPTSIDFGNVPIGSTGGPATVTVTNTGDANLVITSAMIGPNGSDPMDFSLVSDLCSGATLAPNASCTVAVLYTPDHAMLDTGQLVFADNAANSPQTVDLSGNGVFLPPSISVSTNNVAFGTVQVGTTAGPDFITVTNTSTNGANLVIGNITISGLPFAISSDSCVSATLAPGGSCQIGVTFSPTTTGVFSGTVTINDNAPSSPQEVTLSGTGNTRPGGGDDR
jgi:hypothetical protein